MRIAAVVLTYNEVGNLDRCVSHLLGHMPVVVVDSGSHDGTCDLALHLGCRVLKHPWQGFAKQRNYACRELRAEFDWLLFVDADEVFGANLIHWIEKFGSTADLTDAVYFSQRVIIGSKVLNYAPHYPIFHPRLVRTNFPGFVENGSGHGESISADAVPLYVDIPYQHFVLSNGLASWLSKHIRLAVAETTARSLPPSGVRTKRARVNSLMSIGLPRVFSRFVFHFFFCKGILDGRAGFQYSLMYSWFELTKVLLSRDREASQL